MSGLPCGKTLDDYAVGIKRFAGDTFMDNAYTRAYQREMDRYVTGPIARRLASDDVLAGGVSDMVFDAAVRGKGSIEEKIDLLERLKGERLKEEFADGLKGFNEADRNKELQAHADYFARKALEDGRKADVLAVAAELGQLHGGRNGLTHAGTDYRQFVNGPLAAYAAGAAALGLATKAAHDLLGGAGDESELVVVA